MYQKAQYFQHSRRRSEKKSNICSIINLSIE